MNFANVCLFLFVTFLSNIHGKYLSLRYVVVASDWTRYAIVA